MCVVVCLVAQGWHEHSMTRSDVTTRKALPSSPRSDMLTTSRYGMSWQTCCSIGHARMGAPANTYISLSLSLSLSLTHTHTLPHLCPVSLIPRVPLCCCSLPSCGRYGPCQTRASWASTRKSCRRRRRKCSRSRTPSLSCALMPLLVPHGLRLLPTLRHAVGAAWVRA